MKPGFHDRFTVCRPKLQVHSRFPQPEPPQRQQERKGAESWGPCWQEPRRGARSGDRISLSFPSPNLPPPVQSGSPSVTCLLSFSCFVALRVPSLRPASVVWKSSRPLLLLTAPIPRRADLDPASYQREPSHHGPLSSCSPTVGFG